MKKQDLIKEIIQVADIFDKLGMEKEADVFDRIMIKVAQQMDLPDQSDFIQLKLNINTIVRNVLAKEGISNIKNLSPKYIKNLVAVIGAAVRRNNGDIIREMVKLDIPVTQNIERWIMEAITGNVKGMMSPVSEEEVGKKSIEKKSPSQSKRMPPVPEGGLPAPGVKPLSFEGADIKDTNISQYLRQKV